MERLLSTSEKETPCDWESNSYEQSQTNQSHPLNNLLLEQKFQSPDHINQKESQTQPEMAKVFRREPLSGAERFIGVDKPKTYNKAFGCLEDFLLFFENRGPEIKEFASIFKQIEATPDLNRLNQELLPILIDSIEKEGTKMTSEKDKKVMLKITNFFRVEFESIIEFYGKILKVYSMEGFLYRNLNKYLREEDWIQLHFLLPYAFCLFKAFGCGELTNPTTTPGNNCQPSQTDDEQDINTSKLILYRGAKFNEDILSLYDPQTVSTFSWNSQL